MQTVERPDPPNPVVCDAVNRPRFSSLALSKDDGGPLMFKRNVLRRMCIAEGFDPVTALTTMKRGRACIIRVYLEHRIRGDARHAVAEEMIVQAASDQGLIDGSQLPM